MKPADLIIWLNESNILNILLDTENRNNLRYRPNVRWNDSKVRDKQQENEPQAKPINVSERPQD